MSRFTGEEEFPIDDQNPLHGGIHNRRTNSTSHPHHAHHLDGERQSRASRNSLGVREELTAEVLNSDLQRAPTDEENAAKEKDGKALIIAFVGMVFVGLGNKVFNKLMTIPMYNYPNFLNLLTSFIFIPVCFAYIIPMAKYGYIPEEQFQVPKKTFAVMGALDACAGILQIFGATYVPGPLIILLLQAAIPVSMVISKYLVNAQYNIYQYIGALIVAGGIMIVLAPSLTGDGSILWAIMLIVSTIPMALSSVYKEIALGETELDAIYLNGWVAVFQFGFSIILAIPSAYASDPPVPISELPQNLFDGLKCYVGISSYTCDTDDDGCHADRCNPRAPEYYGSSNLLYLALTLMVPLGNVAFTLPFMPERATLQVTDIVGLIVICGGLGCYRFAAKLVERYYNQNGGKYGELAQSEEDAKQQLYSKLIPAEGSSSTSRSINHGDEEDIRS